MARNVYSKQLAFINAVTSAPLQDIVLYTSPVGFITVLRQIDVDFVRINSGTTISFGVRNAIGGATLSLLSSPNPPVQSVLRQWEGRLVMNPGDTLHVSTIGAAADPYLGWASGYQLTTP